MSGRRATKQTQEDAQKLDQRRNKGDREDNSMPERAPHRGLNEGAAVRQQLHRHGNQLKQLAAHGEESAHIAQDGVLLHE